MNWELFSFWGYLSVGLSLLVPFLWLAHALRRPRGWLCHIAVIVAVVALLFAKLNSETYVNRIQIDRSEEIAAAQARQEAARKAAEAARSGEVAQVRFVEDDSDDYLDTAGMDEADLKYMSSLDGVGAQTDGQTGEPAWKKEKKTRSATPVEDNSLESMLDTTAGESKGVDSDLVEAAAAEPIMMPEKLQILANRLDGWNLKLIRWLTLVAVGVVLIDYLKRLNSYEDAYLPLPLPSKLVNDLTPLPPARLLPERQRRTMLEELAWLVRRGDTFLYLTDDRQAAAVPEQLLRLPQLPRFPKLKWPVDVIHATDAQPIDPGFIFETLWYGRSSFVVDSAERVGTLLPQFIERLRIRMGTRAHVKQTVHLVWDMPDPMPEELRKELLVLVRVTGWSVLENNR